MQTPIQPYNDPNSSQQEKPDSRHERINTIWKIVALLYTLIALGVAFWWEADDSGLCLVIREWQGALLGDEYYPVLDILGCLLILLAPLYVIKIIVEKVTGVKIDKVNYRQ